MMSADHKNPNAEIDARRLTSGEIAGIERLWNSIGVVRTAHMLGSTVITIDRLISGVRGTRIRPSTVARVRVRLAATWPAAGGDA